MCGIVGMIGLENVTPGLINGLEKIRNTVATIQLVSLLQMMK